MSFSVVVITVPSPLTLIARRAGTPLDPQSLPPTPRSKRYFSAWDGWGALDPRGMSALATPRKYPDELRERANRTVLDAKSDPATRRSLRSGGLGSS